MGSSRRILVHIYRASASSLSPDHANQLLGPKDMKMVEHLPGAWCPDLPLCSGHLDRAGQMLRASGLAGSLGSRTAVYKLYICLKSSCKSYGVVGLGRYCCEVPACETRTNMGIVIFAAGFEHVIIANVERWDEVERLRNPEKGC